MSAIPGLGHTHVFPTNEGRIVGGCVDCGVTMAPVPDSVWAASADHDLPQPDASDRRERIARAVLSGLAVTEDGPGFDSLYGDACRGKRPELAHMAAVIAVAWADALLAELDKGKP